MKTVSHLLLPVQTRKLCQFFTWRDWASNCNMPKVTVLANGRDGTWSPEASKTSVFSPPEPESPGSNPVFKRQKHSSLCEVPVSDFQAVGFAVDFSSMSLFLFLPSFPVIEQWLRITLEVGGSISKILPAGRHPLTSQAASVVSLMSTPGGGGTREEQVWQWRAPGSLPEASPACRHSSLVAVLGTISPQGDFKRRSLQIVYSKFADEISQTSLAFAGKGTGFCRSHHHSFIPCRIPAPHLLAPQYVEDSCPLRVMGREEKQHR